MFDSAMSIIGGMFRRGQPTSGRLRVSHVRSSQLFSGFRLSVEPLEDRRLLVLAELVKDINNSPQDGAFPRDLTNVGGTLFFSAYEGATGFELWKSDGTETGTVRVKDIRGGMSDSVPRYLTNVGGTLYFSANDGATGFELWKSDGTETGTVRVKDIRGGISDSVPRYLTNVGGTLYFSANDGTTGFELWKSDGTETGTVRVKDNRGGIGGSFPHHLTNLGGTLYFSASDGPTDDELWKSDGTETGTVRVKDIRGGTGNSSPGHLTNMGGTLFFSANDGTTGFELWKSDGTETGTVRVQDTLRGIGNSYPRNLTNVGGTLYFSANDGTNGFELWKSDGTDAGTVRVKDIRGGIGYSSPGYLTNVGGTLYFRANDGVSGSELWKSNGTETGTVRVKDIRGGTYGSSPRHLTNVGGTLYFRANDGPTGDEVWKSDGTDAGTVRVQDIWRGQFMSNPAYLTNVGSTLYFSANDGTTGSELWVARQTEFLVDLPTDEDDGSYVVGDLSLREAVTLANRIPGAITISFDTDGVFATPQSINLSLGELLISGEVIIDGPGADRLTIDAMGNSRVFRIDNNDGNTTTYVTLKGLTISGGVVAGELAGGGIDNDENLVVDSSFITGNSAHAGGGIHSSRGLTIVNSTISENSAALGAGILSRSDVGRTYTSITNSTISGNTAVTNGGGIYGEQASLSITQTTLAGNWAGTSGGAIYFADGDLVLDASTISDNTASLGGALFSNTNLENQSSRIRSSTISGNTATLQGGGLYNLDGRVLIEYTTITDNWAPAWYGSGVFSQGDFAVRTEVRSSIIAGNASTDVDIPAGGFNTFVSLGYNLIGTSNPQANANALTGFTNNDQTGVLDPRLDPLGNNGGYTDTHPPRADSPALNMGNPAAVAGSGDAPAYDQRGIPFGRIINGRIDVGSVEREQVIVDGDFNDDGLYDCLDINALVLAIAAGTNNPNFDLTNDSLVNLADRDTWLAAAGGVNLGVGRVYLFGDANLDGFVDGSDFGIWNTYKFRQAAAWCSGDFNADALVDGSDFGIWNSNKFQTSSRSSNVTVVAKVDPASAAPQPAKRQLSRTRLAEKAMAMNDPGGLSARCPPHGLAQDHRANVADRLFARLRPSRRRDRGFLDKGFQTPCFAGGIGGLGWVADSGGSSGGIPWIRENRGMWPSQDG